MKNSTMGRKCFSYGGAKASNGLSAAWKLASSLRSFNIVLIGKLAVNDLFAFEFTFVVKIYPRS